MNRGGERKHGFEGPPAPREREPEQGPGTGAEKARPPPAERPSAANDGARALADLVRASQRSNFEDIPHLVDRYTAGGGFHHARVYVSDLQQKVLREVTGAGDNAHRGGEDLSIEGTLAGRAFRKEHGHSAPSGDRERHWIPILNGTERLGVLRFDTDRGSEPDYGLVEDLTAQIGLLLVTKRTQSDSYSRLIRDRPMTVSAEMQWALTPPLSFSNGSVTVAANTEPAYENAGDAFDYAFTGESVHLAIFDAMGHDNAAGLTANLAVAACRNLRRHGSGLVETGDGIERILVEQFGHNRYTTGILAELDTGTGLLSWVNRGHLPPMLIRGGRWVTELECPPTHPMGMDLGLPSTLCQERLEPGDRILFYTDGITEGHADGSEFGSERFVRFIIRHTADGMLVPETLRRLVHAVLEHHDGALQDDATVMVCEWHGPKIPSQSP
ncbi:PP2C family protein-serine/threonine phosphatase [Nocardiopsis oceani]